MKQATTLLSLVLGVLLVGCSSSRPVTPSAPAPDTTRTAAPSSSSSKTAPSDTPPPAPSTAPRDWHHLDRVPRSGPGLHTQAAYRTILKGRSPRDTVHLAIIDSGIDVDHEDLSAKMWTNADEVPGNDVDDDQNGYVDDVHGWNFIGGPNGENVNQDTYELTRIYVDLRERFAGLDSAEVAPDARDQYQRYLEIKRTFQKERREAKKKLQKVRQLQKNVQIAKQVLKQYLQADTLTQEAVASISSSRRRIGTAQEILRHYYEQGPEALQEYHDYLKRQVKYNYNPDFNPRPTVGDDYSDKTERYYGNNDVVGPDAGHGTHVAGIAGATRNNGLGVDGVARGVRVMTVRTVPNGDERDKDVANAIRYAVENGAEVINMSFGKDYSPHKEVVDAAVQYADSMGVLMVHAAGNDGANLDSTNTDNYPSPFYRDGGQAQLWIEVGASSWKGGKNLAAPFSNYGAETVDVFAPSQSIYSTAPDNEYDRQDGTSMAAPMVSGLAALIMAYYPSLPPAKVRSIILDTATRYTDQLVNRPGGPETVRFGTLSETGAVVNAYAALQRADEVASSE